MCVCVGGSTSSSLNVIMVKALNTQSVCPVMVMILSGQDPSEMLILALLCGCRQRWRDEGGKGGIVGNYFWEGKRGREETGKE